MSALSTPVLVLNKNWGAVRVVDARQAMRYLARGAAEVIDEAYNQYDLESWQALSQERDKFEPTQHAFIKTVRDRILVPVIIRLVHNGRHRIHRIRLTRRNVYARDRNTCQYCGNKFSTSDLNIDHVIPRCQGGTSTWGNLVCSCIECNSRKGGRTPEQAGMQLIREPAPLLIPADLPPVAHKSWKQFVDSAYWNVELMD